VFFWVSISRGMYGHPPKVSWIQLALRGWPYIPFKMGTPQKWLFNFWSDASPLAKVELQHTWKLCGMPHHYHHLTWVFLFLDDWFYTSFFVTHPTCMCGDCAECHIAMPTTPIYFLFLDDWLYAGLLEMHWACRSGVVVHHFNCHLQPFFCIFGRLTCR